MKGARFTVIGIQGQRILQEGNRRLIGRGGLGLLDGGRDPLAAFGGLSLLFALTVACGPALADQLLQLTVRWLELQRAFEDFEGGLV